MSQGSSRPIEAGKTRSHRWVAGVAAILALMSIVCICAQPAIAAQGRSGAPRHLGSHRNYPGLAKLGFSQTRSATHPYSSCAPAEPRHFRCMAIAIPRGAILPTNPRTGPQLAPGAQIGAVPDELAHLAPEGSGEEGGLSPSDLQSAYRTPSSGGSGQTIAIVNAYDNPNAEADLNVYRSHYGLPECTTANGCFKKVNQKGQEGSYPKADAGWSEEISLDLDMASAICPKCHILLVEANSTFFSDLGAAELTAASFEAPGWGPTTAVSNSWGAEEPFPYSEEEAEAIGKEEQELDKYFEHPGIPVLASAGDLGYGVSYPAASPSVISVGGTALYKAPFNERGWFEEAWNDTGGGCSAYEPKPSWQSDEGCPTRIDNDIAAVASPRTPVSVYDSFENPGWMLFGGTSASSPIMAGVEALSSSAFRTEGAEAFYTHPDSLFDVTAGSNLYVYEEGESFETYYCKSSYFCYAGPGYDGPTGNGTPDMEGGGKGLPRKWTEMPVSGVWEGSSHAVSCPTKSFCMELDEGPLSPRTWDGVKWASTAEIVTEPGWKFSGLAGVSCTSETFCMATGYYETAAGNYATLAESWNGSAWSLRAIATPSESKFTFLSGVSCVSSSSCTAVGYYITSSGTTLTLAESWNGSTWSIQSTPNPSEATVSRLWGVSCVSSSACTAVGYQAGTGMSKTLAESWNGSAWSIKATPNAAGATKYNYLNGVSCVGSNECMAVGESDAGAMVEAWNGKEWTRTVQWSSGTYLTSVSCASASFCEATGVAGGIFSESFQVVAERYDGSGWSEEDLPRLGETSFSTVAVSCSEATVCVATNGEIVQNRSAYYFYRNEALALHLNGATWTAETMGSPTVDNAVACAAETECVAVGQVPVSKGTGISHVWNGAVWSDVTVGVPSGSRGSGLQGVSCPQVGLCEAVGWSVNSSGVKSVVAQRLSNETHARYNQWGLQPAPNPEGAKAAGLSGVSCASASACLAVGSYTNGSGTEVTLAESGDGTSWSSPWSIQSTPNPSGAKAAHLSGVSCASASACLAVGSYTNSSGVEVTLAESWNGSSWSIQSTPNPEGAKAARLSGVSCASASSCTAVGSYTNGSGTEVTLAESWNGSSWSIQSTPNPSGAKAARLSGVSCSALTCTVVGSYTNGSGTEATLSESWNGSAWSIQSTSNPEGAKATSLNGVACSSHLCLAAGGFTDSNSVKRSLSEARLGLGPQAGTEPATNLSSTSSQLNGKVSPEGLETTYYFEYGLTASYGSKAPASAESIGSGKEDVAVSKQVKGLEPATTYHYRVVATNEIGTTYGADRTFATQGDPPTFTFSFGSSGTGNGQLNKPSRVAVDSEGNLWVTDELNNRVQHFSPEGKYLGQFGSKGSGNGQFSSPVGIAIDSSGNLWVADYFNNRVQHFSPEGKYLGQFGVTETPRDIAIDPEGNLWIATVGGYVQHFSPEGKYLGQFGSSGTGNGQFKSPRGIAIDPEGHIWVVDGKGHRVQEFSSKGEYLGQFGSSGSGAGQFGSLVEGIAIDPSGNLWIVDKSNNRVQKWSRQGVYLGSFGSEGSGAGQFSLPTGIAAVGNGGLWVMDSGNDRVERWTAPPPTFTFSFGSSGTGNGQLNKPSRVAVDSEGNLWVTDELNNRVQHFSPEGKYLGQFGSKGSGNGQFSSPVGIAIDSSGNLWVADYFNNRVQHFSPEGKYLGQFGVTETPRDIAIDPEGNLWIATVGGYVQHFSPEGKYLGQFGSSGTGNGQFKSPRGIAIDPEGHIWVVDGKGHRVQEFSSKGEYLGQFGSSGSGAGQFGSLVEGIAIDPSGNLWIVDKSNNRVQKWSRQGVYLGSFGSEGSGAGQFSLPTGIAAVGNGGLWVMDSGNDRVERWRY